MASFKHTKQDGHVLQTFMVSRNTFHTHHHRKKSFHKKSIPSHNLKKGFQRASTTTQNSSNIQMEANPTCEKVLFIASTISGAKSCRTILRSRSSMSRIKFQSMPTRKVAT